MKTNILLLIAYFFIIVTPSLGQESMNRGICSQMGNAWNINNIIGIDTSTDNKEENLLCFVDNKNEEDIIQPDFAYGMLYTTEYLADLNNVADWDAGIGGSKRTRGFTRNYFTAEDGGKVRLLRKNYGSSNYEFVDCFWYIDNVCVNKNNPKSELNLRENPGAYKVEARLDNDVLFSFTAAFVDAPEIMFTPHSAYDGEYGFDDNRYDEIARLNGAVYLDKDNKYIVPFMSIQKGQTATIEANIMYDKKILGEQDMQNIEVDFVPSSPGILISKRGDNQKNGILECRLSDFVNGKIELDIKPEVILKDAYIEAKIGQNVVGRINLRADVCVKVSDLILVKIIANKRLGENIDMANEKIRIEELLNTKSFNQAFVKWNIIRTEVFNMEINKDTIKLSDIFEQAVKFYKDNNLKPEKAAVMFISDSDLPNDANGYGYVAYSERNKFSIVHTKALKGKSPAHELAHNMGLQDLGGEFKSYFYDTNNFMDYYSTYNNDNRNMFFKFQWDYIYNQVLSKQTVSLF